MKVSCFRNYTDRLPATTTIDALVSMMRGEGDDGERLAALTDTYRRTGSKAVKAESPLFAVACRFDGGKARANVTALTGLSLVDVDHVGAKDERLAALRQKAMADPHTLLCYTTISGCGLRIIFRYELDTAFDINAQRHFYAKAFLVGNAYYASLLGTPTDLQCKNVTRLSGLAHDAQAYYNPDAVPFTAEQVLAESRGAAARESRQRKRRRELARLQACYDTIIKREVEADGATYAPGSHNDYVMRVGYKLNEFGFSRDAAVEWARSAFPDYADTEQVVASCYSHTEAFATRSTGNRPQQRTRDGDTYASVDDIKAFLDGHIRLRYNEVTGRVEHLGDEWLPITDRIVNSLWTEMSRTMRVNVNDIFRVIDSDYVPPFNPFRDYLDGLPAWHEQHGDHIAALADTITVAGGEAKQQLFRCYLKKWLVAMVAARRALPPRPFLFAGPVAAARRLPLLVLARGDSGTEPSQPPVRNPSAGTGARHALLPQAGGE